MISPVEERLGVCQDCRWVGSDMKSNQGSSSVPSVQIAPFEGSLSNKSISSTSSSCRVGRPNPSSSTFTSLTMKTLASVLVISLVIGHAHSFVMGSRPLSKRSFFDIQCKGVYDKGIFAKLDRICDDCYNLYREPQLHSLCRSNCFGSPYFKGCLDALLLNEEEGKFDEMIEILGKKK